VIANSDVQAPPGLTRLVDFGDLQVLGRADPVPRDLVAFSASVAADDAAVARMRDPQFDPNREILLASGETLSSNAAPMTVQAQSSSATSWRAHVSMPQAGYLLQREAWYPGWKAKVDGVETEIVRADVLYRAVPLSQGGHDVEVYFESASFSRGALFSLAGLVITGVLLALPIIRTRVRR
jgi:hypothetical protein